MTEEQILAGSGIRPTANRIVVMRELASSQRPLSLAELESRLPTMDKSSIFRALTVFRGHHIVHVIEDGGEGVRYELCRSAGGEADTDAHAHFFCERCHRTFCLDYAGIPDVELPAGFRSTSVNFVIKGICPECGQ